MRLLRKSTSACFVRRETRRCSMRGRIPEIARNEISLRNFFVPKWWVENLSPDELQYGIDVRGLVLHSWTSVHQILRAAWNDSLAEPLTDWYRPFLENVCAFQGHRFRQLLGMEPSLGKNGRNPANEAIARGTFANFVLSGAADPFTRRKEYYDLGDRQAEVWKQALNQT